MSNIKNNKNPVEDIFSDPIKLALFIVGSVLVMTILIAFGSFRINSTHGSLALLEPPNPLELKGQEVYYQEGCQYCHTQTIRPIEAEVKRYVNEKSYGYFRMPDINEYQYETPSMRGSQRIGPDLARIAGSNIDSKDSLRSVLKGKSGLLSGIHHNYGYLFQSSFDMEPLFLSWKIRMMMQTRSKFSDNYQKSVFDALEGKTRGDALVAYLLGLGRRQKDFAGSYFK